MVADGKFAEGIVLSTPDVTAWTAYEESNRRPKGRQDETPRLSDYLYQAAHCINSNRNRSAETTERAVAIPRPVLTRHKVQYTAATAKAIVSQPLVALASSGTRAMTMHARSESPTTIANVPVLLTFMSDVLIRFENTKHS